MVYLMIAVVVVAAAAADDDDDDDDDDYGVVDDDNDLKYYCLYLSYWSLLIWCLVYLVLVWNYVLCLDNRSIFCFKNKTSLELSKLFF